MLGHRRCDNYIRTQETGQLLNNIHEIVRLGKSKRAIKLGHDRKGVRLGHSRRENYIRRSTQENYIRTQLTGELYWHEVDGKIIL